jgi:hypothetical protein
VARRQLSSVARCTGLGARVGTAHGSLTSLLSRPWCLTAGIGNSSIFESRICLPSDYGATT